MTAVIIGSIGFLCCFLYDHNSIRLKKSFLHPFFSIGCFLIAVSTGLVIRRGWPTSWRSGVRRILFLPGRISGIREGNGGFWGPYCVEHIVHFLPGQDRVSGNIQ